METAAKKPTAKKRTVNREEWQEEKRKRLRVAGKAYVNKKGQLVEGRQPGPDCNCRRKCYERVNEATRMKIFKAYYELKSYDEQNSYLFGLIRKVPIARKRAESSTKRTCTYKYYVRVDGEDEQICAKALENIHGIGRGKISSLCEKLGKNVLYPRDERGRHQRITKFSEETIELVKSHIYSIIRTTRARYFLKDDKANNGPEVNLTRMHKDFLDTHDPNYVHRLAEYEKLHGSAQNEDAGAHQSTYHNQTWGSYSREQGDNSSSSEQPPAGSQPQQPASSAGQPPLVQKKKKPKGLPEPFIRLWYYSKVFHEIYTTKEANGLRRKANEWKSSQDYVPMKVIRKPRVPRKQPRSETSPRRPGKTKNPQGPSSAATEMYSLYPKIIQDLSISRLEEASGPLYKAQGTSGPFIDHRNFRQ